MDDEKKVQGVKNPQVGFFECIIRLKLFIEEADSLGVLPLVDDFCLRENHDFFFGEDNYWLRKVRGNRPKTINLLLRAHMDYFPRFYAQNSSTLLACCSEAYC